MTPSEITSVPSILYRYFSYERAVDLIKTHQLRFNNPSNYNDPFECYPAIDIKLSWKAYIPVIGIGSIINDCNKQKEIARLYRTALGKSFRVCCFSEAQDSLLMWAHYAHEHCGIVIGFHTALDYWGNDLFGVNYVADRICLPSSFKRDDNAPLVADNWQRALLVTKAECWSYEKEWRCIKRLSDCCYDKDGYFLSIDKSVIASVTFGCRVEIDSQKCLICQTALKTFQ